MHCAHLITLATKQLPASIRDILVENGCLVHIGVKVEVGNNLF